MDNNRFEPRIGKMRAGGSKRASKYLHRVLAAAALRGGIKIGGARRFTGSRIGRGSGVGRLLGSRDVHAAFRTRRAIVKTRIARLGGKGQSAARAHLRYIQRDGVTREGAPGELYAADREVADDKDFLERSSNDRHQFRFIVAPEDGAEYQDLKPLTRRLMAAMEHDLGTKLDWVAVDHYNTGHPHTHIMLRGVDDKGQNLVISREYISHGMRERVAGIVTLDLGPRTTLEIEARMRDDSQAERLTDMDRRLLRERDTNGVVLPIDRDPFRQTMRVARLQKLRQLGLAEPLRSGRWQLVGGFDETLKAMGERGDIIRTMQRELIDKRLNRASADRVIFDATDPATRPVVGRLVTRGLSDEFDDRHFVIVDGVDGRTHYVDIGSGENTPLVPNDAIIRIAARSTEIREVDRTIVAVAAAHGGRYDVDRHLVHDPSATEAFATTHVRRLEAMHRTLRSVTREADGSWVIAPDHLERAAAYEARLAKDRPVALETLSSLPLAKLPKLDAATWLDRELTSDAPRPIRDAGFGREVKTALDARRQWLVGQELAEEIGGRTTYRANMIATLQRRELLRVAGQLSDELGLAFTEAQHGERIAGTLKRSVDLASGKFALVERSRDFTLVPWRPVLERQIGKSVSGTVGSGGIDWTIGRGRSGLMIS